MKSKKAVRQNRRQVLFAEVLKQGQHGDELMSVQFLHSKLLFSKKMGQKVNRSQIYMKSMT